MPDELQYVEVIAVTDKKGNDEETTTIKPDGEEETSLPETVTLLVTPEQANILAELEAQGEIHVALVYRGTAENAQKSNFCRTSSGNDLNISSHSLILLSASAILDGKSVTST